VVSRINRPETVLHCRVAANGEFVTLFVAVQKGWSTSKGDFPALIAAGTW
jgi:hypothetical protein